MEKLTGIHAVREALAALIRTQRTLESGLYYETRPENTVAAELCRRIQDAVAEKLARMERSRLAAECAKLDPKFEKAMAEEGLSRELDTWPEY